MKEGEGEPCIDAQVLMCVHNRFLFSIEFLLLS